MIREQHKWHNDLKGTLKNGKIVILGEQTVSVFEAMVVNNTAYCLRCDFNWNFYEAAQGQVQNVWNIRVQVLFVEKHSPLVS